MESVTKLSFSACAYPTYVLKFYRQHGKLKLPSCKLDNPIYLLLPYTFFRKYIFHVSICVYLFKKSSLAVIGLAFLMVRHLLCI